MSKTDKTIVTKTPMRISFVGGGTDIPHFYQRHGGAVISTAIDKYVTVRVEARERGSLEARNPIVRECLQKVGIDAGVEIKIESDIPPGSGLGGSSALTVGLLNALYAYKHTRQDSPQRQTFYRRDTECTEKDLIRKKQEKGFCFSLRSPRLGGECDSAVKSSAEQIACEACEIEIDRLGAPIGKQDQYAAAYGGLKRYDFYQDGKVGIACIDLCWDFEPYLMLFDTGIRREAKKLLAQPMDVESLKCIKAQVSDFYNLLTIRRDYPEIELGRLLHKTWRLKSGASDGISNGRLDTIYRTALDNGALGGKLLGAGGGGYFLFCVKPSDRGPVIKALDGLATHVLFNFEPRGSRFIH